MSSPAQTQASALVDGNPAAKQADSHAAPWLCVAGAKGGVGKTMLATNLALQFSQNGYRTLLVDFDPGTGNVGVHLRLTSDFNLEDVASGHCTPERAIVKGPHGLDVLLGQSGATEVANLQPHRVATLLRDLRRAAKDTYEVVVIDTGAGLSTATLAVAASSELTLGVTTSEVTSLTDAYALCKVLHLRGCPQPKLVVNRVRSRNEAMQTAGKLSSITQKFLGVPSELCGWISNDPAVEQSTRQQRPLLLAASQSTQTAARQDLCMTAAAALGQLPPLQRTLRAPKTQRLRMRPSCGNSP
ncbi:MAG: AAA family ATPase [Planctomycetota bacterium]